MKNLPPTLLIHAKDEHWVPSQSPFHFTNSLNDAFDKFTILRNHPGGHNEFD